MPFGRTEPLLACVAVDQKYGIRARDYLGVSASFGLAFTASTHFRRAYAQQPTLTQFGSPNRFVGGVAYSSAGLLVVFSGGTLFLVALDFLHQVAKIRFELLG